MPYGNYSFVIDSSFKPFTLQEMLVPFAAYKEAYEKMDETYNDLAKQTDVFKYLEGVAEENPDSKAAKLYKGYADELHKQSEDFGKHGLTMDNGRALSNLRRRFHGEIGRLAEADVALRKEQDLRRQMATRDTSMLYAIDNLSIDDFLDNGNPNLYGISGNELYTRGANLGKAASSRMYKAGEGGSAIGGYYKIWKERMGVSQDSIAAFMNTQEVQQQVDNILRERGVFDNNLSDAKIAIARQSVMNGIYDGIAYQESSKLERNYGVLTASENASLASQGFTYKNGKLTYDKTLDPKYQREEAKQGYTDKEFEKVLGELKNGKKLLTIDDSTGKPIAKQVLEANSKYPIFFGDAFWSDVSHGFDELDFDSCDIDLTDLKPMKINQITSDEGKEQLRNFVRNNYKEFVKGFTPGQIDLVIDAMDFQVDRDWGSDNHYMLKIPGTDPEKGTITDKSAFEAFTNTINQIRLGRYTDNTGSSSTENSSEENANTNDIPQS